jgi:hypothetical protein
MIIDPQGDEQQAEHSCSFQQQRASDGPRHHCVQAQKNEPRSRHNSQQPDQSDLVASVGKRKSQQSGMAEASARRDPPAGEGISALQGQEARTGLRELLIELEQERLGSSIIERAFFAAPLTDPPRERSAEWRAWEQLRFASLLPPAEFDEELAAQGWYSAVYHQHSDRGLAEIEAKEKPPSSELAAFKRLEEMGVLTESDFYSPAKAKNQFYTNRLANQLHSYSNNERTRTRSGRGPKGNQAGSGKAAVEMEKYRRRRHKEG